MAEPEDLDAILRKLEKMPPLEDVRLSEPALYVRHALPPGKLGEADAKRLRDNLDWTRANFSRLRRVLDRLHAEAPERKEDIDRVEDYLLREGAALKALEARLEDAP